MVKDPASDEPPVACEVASVEGSAATVNCPPDTNLTDGTTIELVVNVPAKEGDEPDGDEPAGDEVKGDEAKGDEAEGEGEEPAPEPKPEGEN